MIGEEIVGDKTVSLVEVKEILTQRKKEGELKYEQEQSLKYANTFIKGKKPALVKLEKELETIAGIDSNLRAKIIDTVPKHIEVMETLVEKGMDVDEESLKAAQKAVNDIVYKK